MKTLIYKNGDLLTDPNIQIVAHCTNVQGIMGSGIALSIKEMYPIAYDAYKNAEKNGGLKLGEISYAGLKRNGHQFVIFNLVGQNLYGSGTRHVNYEAIYSSLEKMRTVCDMAKPTFGTNNNSMPTVGFPYKMGSDRAGGRFEIIEKMIEVVFSDYTGDVVIVKLV